MQGQAEAFVCDHGVESTEITRGDSMKVAAANKQRREFNRGFVYKQCLLPIFGSPTIDVQNM